MTGIKQTKKRKQSASAAEPAEKPNEPVNSKVSESDSGSDSEPDSEKLTALLEPYSKDQLIDLISAAAVKNPSLYKYIREAADREETHRKIFVYGLGWDTTRESLISAFETSGEIEDCKLVTDKVTGKAKGYAFILFKTRKSAMKALSTPQRKINNRVTSCQLASVGPAATSAAGGRDNQGSAGDRKIYVSNVQRDVDKQKLREFFERYGEIETGPIGFDVNTGKSRGFALFVYKTVEGAKKALDEPIKMFCGHQLHCQKAADGKNKTNISSVSNSNNNNTNSNSNNQLQMVQGQQMLQGQRQGLDALAAAQNWALLGQGLNPAVYGGLLANPGLINPVVAGALTQGVVPTSHVNMGAIGSSSMLGGYGAAQGLQNVYPNAQNRAQGSGGTYPGYTSYIWYGLFLTFLEFLYQFALIFVFSCICARIVSDFAISDAIVFFIVYHLDVKHLISVISLCNSFGTFCGTSIVFRPTVFLSIHLFQYTSNKFWFSYCLVTAVATAFTFKPILSHTVVFLIPFG